MIKNNKIKEHVFGILHFQIIQQAKIQKVIDSVLTQANFTLQHLYHTANITPNQCVRIISVGLSHDRNSELLKSLIGVNTLVIIIESLDKHYLFRELKNVVYMIEAMNITNLHFLIDTMNNDVLQNWKQSLFDEAQQAISQIIKGYYKKNINQTPSVFFTPTGILQDENILGLKDTQEIVEFGRAQWIKDQGIKCVWQQFIEIANTKKTKAQKNLKKKLVKQDLKFIIQRVDEDLKGCFGYIIQGKIKTGMRVITSPQLYFGIIKEIQIGQTPHRQASFGHFAYIKFANQEKMNLKVDSILCNYEIAKIPKQMESVLVKMKIVNGKKFQYKDSTASIYGSKFSLNISCMLEKQDKYKNMVKITQSENFSELIKSKQDGDVYIIKMDLSQYVSVDHFKNNPLLSRVLIYNTEYTAIGQITELHPLKQIIQFPRIYFAPQDQVYDVITKEKRDYQQCPVDLTNIVDTILVPCGHLAACRKCTHKATCPFCRKRIDDRLNVQVIELQFNQDLIDYSVCDGCMKNVFSHAVIGCSHAQFLCDECAHYQKSEMNCRICNAIAHKVCKIYLL